MQRNYRIPREPVTSSNIAAVGHCAETQELDVEFNSGDAWRYYGVPRNEYLALRESTSPGRYYIRQIRGTYSGVPLDRVTGEPMTPQSWPDGQPKPVQEREP